MKKQIYDEKNGLSYTLYGDYYFPDLEINEEEPTYGKYGIMRKQFLKEHRSARYQYLVLTGKLTEHLNQVDKETRDYIIERNKKILLGKDELERFLVEKIDNKSYKILTPALILYNYDNRT